MTTPITVAVERHVDPTREHEAIDWVRSGIDLAATFDGFLGSGWVRSGPDDDRWYMLYRFTDVDSLERWEDSEERAAWSSAGTDFAVTSRVERRSGIEGWFDVASDGATIAAPPRWKQAVSIWLGFFPVNLAATFMLGLIPGFLELPLWTRVLATTLLLTPIMVYLVLPFVTRQLRPWLQRSPRRIDEESPGGAQ
ncbi:antibiotic biosynthesis monooxygenase [Humidisolicoccus flavus]|uniref:antibiotic biosynthesis monooxygenase n=1 Tax=Humidisolicoccus flavus TaxID=3111414 RepID=UPI00324EAB98